MKTNFKSITNRSLQADIDAQCHEWGTSFDIQCIGTQARVSKGQDMFAKAFLVHMLVSIYTHDDKISQKKQEMNIYEGESSCKMLQIFTSFTESF